jgi:hypothetical protein
MRQKIDEAAPSDAPYPKMIFPEMKKGDDVKEVCTEANKDLVRFG